MLCVECGLREAKYEGLCEECFLKKVKFTNLPEHLNLTVCPHCHSVKLGGSWEDIALEDAIFKIVEKNMEIKHELDTYRIEIEHEEKPDRDFYGEVNVHVKYGDLNIVEKHPVMFHIKYQSCPRCDRYFGNYFEAILQIRNIRDYEENEIIDYIYRRIEHYAKRNRNLFITKEVRKREGWDFYLSDKKEAKKIARDMSHRYGARIKESPQLAGRKDGHDIYRVTYSIRLPDYRVGDIVRIDDQYALVKDIRVSFVKVLFLKDLSERLMDAKRHRISLAKKNEELRDGLIVYSMGKTTEILTEDNRVIDINTSAELESGINVKYFEANGEIYVIPQNRGGNSNKGHR